MQYAIRYYKSNREPLLPVAAAATKSWSPRLVFDPGFYSYNNSVYDLTRPGYYVLTHQWTAAEPWCNTTRMTVYGGDPIALLSAAAQMSAFGDADKPAAETTQQWMDRISVKARTSKVSLLCGDLHSWARDRLLTPNGIKVRLVHFLTMEAPNNSVDGHVALEVLLDGQWVLADLSTKVMFAGANGLHLNAVQTVDGLASGGAQEVPIAVGGYAVERANDNFDSTSYAEAYLLTDDDRRAWRRRIFQAVGLAASDGLVYFRLPRGAESRERWVLSLSPAYRVTTDHAQWQSAFYGGN